MGVNQSGKVIKFCSVLYCKRFLLNIGFLVFEVVGLDVKLIVDGEEISLNEFVVKILSSTIVGAVSALRGINKDWKEIKIEIKRTQ